MSEHTPLTEAEIEALIDWWDDETTASVSSAFPIIARIKADAHAAGLAARTSTATADTDEDEDREYPPLTPRQRELFIGAADAALKVRRNVLLLASHASGHRKHPHGESCEKCRENWPCPDVMRAAGPSLNAVADLPSQRGPATADTGLRERVEALADEWDHIATIADEPILRARSLDRCAHQLRKILDVTPASTEGRADNEGTP